MFKLDLASAGRRLHGLLAAVLLALTVPANAFHFPWDQGHDTTESSDPSDPGPDDRNPNDPDCNGNSDRSPVYAANGQAFWRATDLVLPGRPYMGIYRVYNCADPVVGMFGNGWSVDFDNALYPASKSGVQQRIFKAANGKRFAYTKQADGTFKAVDGRFDTITEGATTVTMTSPDGRRSIFALDGRLLQRIDASGNTVTFSYDGALRLSRIADGAGGRSLNLLYNSQGFVSTVTDHGGRSWSYAYSAAGNLISVTNAGGGVTRYTWQAYKPPADAQTYQQLLTATDSSGVVQVSFTYVGNQVASYTEGANRYTYTRPASNTKLSGTVTRRDALNVTSSFTYGALGLVTRDVDGMGGTTSFVYDANGRITQTTDALGRIWTNTYDNLGRFTSGRNPLGAVGTVQYAGADPRPARLVSPGGRVVSLSYDGQGNLVTLTDAAGAVSRATYSAAGDVTSVSNGLNQLTAITYNVVGLPIRVTDALGRVSTMTYDALGRRLTGTNAEGQTTRFTYDILDRVTSVVDASNQTTAYTYDSAGRLTSVTDPKGSTTQYTYDAFGRRAAEVAPDGRRTTYSYRLDNRLSQVTWPDNSTIAYDYDNNKRVTRETAGADVVTYTYNAVNQLTSATGPGGTVAYTYDNAGRVATETSGGRTHTVARNADGERIRLDYLGDSQTYTRDMRGRVTRIAGSAGNFDFSYDAVGRRTQLGYPNGSITRYTYDAAGQVTNLTHAGLFNASYGHSFDNAGRITRLTGDGPDWNYSYDSSGRLTSAVQLGNTFNYAPDAVGNLLEDGRTYDASHRLTGDSAKAYAYDQRGNLTLEQERGGAGSKVAYGWNLKNQLLRVDYFANSTTTTPTRTLLFTYDPLGRRATKTDAGLLVRYVYDGNDLVGTLDSGGAVTSRTVFSSNVDEPLATTTGANTQFHHANYVGSIVANTSASALTHAYRYGPYGETLAGSSPDSNPFRYAAREKDTSELYYNRARYYHTGIKRFLSADPIGLAGGANPYIYAAASPTNFRDSGGTILDTLLDIGFIGYDLYRLVKDNVLGDCDNFGENALALGADVAGALIPFATGGGAAVRAGTHADDVVRAIKAGEHEGVIYRVPGEFTPSGKDYIGRSDDLAQRTRNATDGRDRTHAEVIGTYPKGNVSEARRAEQQAINDHGGVPNLDNKRNEIAPSKWPDFGVK